MMVKVKGKMIPWQEGMTVSDVLKALDDPNPYVVVRINETHISRPAFETYPVPDHSEVFPLPLITGG
jgi:sulfur carrier protein ThiS